MTPLIQITKCSNSMYWYANKIGDVVPLIKEDAEYYWAYEPDGFINIIAKNDAIPHPTRELE